jgi:hypothetical protein
VAHHCCHECCKPGVAGEGVIAWALLFFVHMRRRQGRVNKGTVAYGFIDTSLWRNTVLSSFFGVSQSPQHTAARLALGLAAGLQRLRCVSARLYKRSYGECSQKCLVVGQLHREAANMTSEAWWAGVWLACAFGGPGCRGSKGGCRAVIIQHLSESFAWAGQACWVRPAAAWVERRELVVWPATMMWSSTAWLKLKQ